MLDKPIGGAYSRPWQRGLLRAQDREKQAVQTGYCDEVLHFYSLSKSLKA